MKIRYLDGTRLRRAILAGTATLIANTENLNAINVFPVPDGDTGTNMAHTVKTIARRLVSMKPVRKEKAGEVLEQTAASALQGARGNSGAILAQFFCGLAEELKADARVNAQRFAEAVRNAVQKTKTALSVPKEGTILTVLSDWALALQEKASVTEDIAHVFMAGYEKAKESLARTKTMLPEMKKAGVVDAGAKGFVHLLDGIADYMQSGSIRHFARNSKAGRTAPPEDSSHEFHDASEHGFEPMIETGRRYCTEALLSSVPDSLETIRLALNDLGDSIVVAGNDSMAKIHIHTDMPSVVFDVLDRLGTIETHKIDDMKLQQSLAVRAQTKGKANICAIVVDTGCDLPQEFMLEHGIIKIPARIDIDGMVRPDGPALDAGRIISLMKDEPGFSLSTSLPDESSYTRAFSLALGYAGEVLYIGLSGALSGTFEAGVRAAKKLSPSVVCFDSRSVTSGTGALVARAVQLAEAGMRAEEIKKELAVFSSRVSFFVAVRDLSSLIRSGRLHGLKSVILRKFGLRPLLTTNTEGKAETAGVFLSRANSAKVIFKKLASRLPKGEPCAIFISHVSAECEARELQTLCARHFGPQTDIHISEMGPLLSSIAWLGALGAAGFAKKPLS
ncbi:MAG: DegV family protein [Spirochaetia bacterium]|nr:DegV family protein [Spirochaetia bacterium]